MQLSKNGYRIIRPEDATPGDHRRQIRFTSGFRFTQAAASPYRERLSFERVKNGGRAWSRTRDPALIKRML